MAKNYAVILFIAEKNCGRGQLEDLISILTEEHDFEFKGSSFSGAPEHQHDGTLLIKTYRGDNADVVIEGVKRQLEGIDYPGLMKFNCQLSVAGIDTVSESIFIS